MGVDFQRNASTILPPGRASVPTEGDWVYPTEPIWTDFGKKLLSPQRNEPRTLQHVASRYTDYATSAPCLLCVLRSLPFNLERDIACECN
jgi:hypothetical protein